MKHLLKPLTLACILLLAAACKKSNNVNPGKGIELNLSATQLQQASGNNDFTFNLFRSVSYSNTSGSNLMLSPLSVSMDLGMTSNGANGATLDSMRKALGFGNFSQDDINSYYNKLITELPELDPNTTLKIANSIWYRQDFSVTSAFLKTGNTSYLAAVQSLDFTNPNSNTITAFGIPSFYYVLERATNLTSPVWVDVQTNQAATNGIINAGDTFWDLGGVKPAPSAFYQLKWQP